MWYENSEQNRRIALVDCNNFYASCERVFRPEWEHRPVAVLSNNDGCIIARSEELKEAEIPMGAPWYQVRDRLRQIEAVVVSSNYALYGDMSARVMQLLAAYAAEIEVYSIDECWLDLTGMPLRDVEAYCRGMVGDIRRMTGIPVSVGIGPTKVLAKAANRLAKKRKVTGAVFDLSDPQLREVELRDLPVGDLWGVGRRWKRRLQENDILSARDLRDTDTRWIRQHFNVVLERMVCELRGIACIGPEVKETKEQIIASRSFGQTVTEKADLAEALTFHTCRAGEKLRAQGSEAAYLSAFIQTSRFREGTPQYSPYCGVRLAFPSCDSRVLTKASLHCLERMYRPGYRFCKAGIMLSEISSQRVQQGELFAERDFKADHRLMAAMDGINRRFGRGAVFLAAQGTDQRWKMRQAFKTPAYTTRWDEIPQVH